MAEYIDNKAVVLDGCLLSYETDGDGECVIVPTEAGGIPIHTIGSGSFSFRDMQGVIIPDGIRAVNCNAFMDCMEMEYATVFPSVKKIGEYAFDASHKLKTVYQILIYTDEEYIRIKSECACNGGTRYMAYEVPQIGDNYYIPDKAFGIQKTNRLPKGISRLFVSTYDTWGFPVSYKFPMGKVPGARNIFFPAGSKAVEDERDAVKFLLKEGYPEPDPRTEQKNVEIRTVCEHHGTGFHAYRTRVFLFDDKNTRHVNGKHYVIGEHSIGYHFWQSLLPVTSGGKTFYKYGRCVLSVSSPGVRYDLDYIRYNVGFVDENGYIETE
ncbi:MAG: leucine-rich repeat domain-containing protein [Lachnospiraceae bacterium]|nr:leucine-rich repeat domain-containing protein [Lachnospiraceae bacterium]